MTDFTGLKPNHNESACMAAYVYGDKDKEVSLIGGWAPEFDSKYTIGTGEWGFKSMLFSRTVDGKTEYALAFAGTDNSSFDLLDFYDDLVQLLGVSPQYTKAMSMAKELKKELNGAELTFVGHSLGGGLSTAAAYATSGTAVTFNPAGVTPFTRYENKRAKIDAYVNPNDPVHFSNRLFINKNADGNVHIEEGRFSFFKLFKEESHSIYNFIKPYYKDKK